MDTYPPFLMEKFGYPMKNGPKSTTDTHKNIERFQKWKLCGRKAVVQLSSKNTNRSDQLKKVQEEALALFEKKNADYGDAFAAYGGVGVLVRLGDKIARLRTVTKTSVQFVNNESLRDTLIDLHNYAAMAIMLLDED